MTVEFKHTVISWDWKEMPSKEALQRALKPFGVVVSDDPSHDGSDQIGYVFSDRELTQEELKGLTES